jgi:hypothetical protein
LTIIGEDLISVVVRLRLLAGVCDDETDGERDRCFRILVVDTGVSTTSMGSVSLTTQFFSLSLIRSYSASEINGVNLDFFFFADD